MPTGLTCRTPWPTPSGPCPRASPSSRQRSKRRPAARSSPEGRSLPCGARGGPTRPRGSAPRGDRPRCLSGRLGPGARRRFGAPVTKAAGDGVAGPPPSAPARQATRRGARSRRRSPDEADAAARRSILGPVSTAAPAHEAVLHGEGPLLILAGAGSGKTAVLTRRIAHLVRSGQAQPGEILAITFTNKAAAEMRERVEGLVGRRTRAMWVMTFHSACARMLRADAHWLGYTRSFTIYDEADSMRLVKVCLEGLDVDPKRFTPRAVKRQISDAKNRLEDAAAYR